MVKTHQAKILVVAIMSLAYTMHPNNNAEIAALVETTRRVKIYGQIYLTALENDLRRKIHTY